MDHSKVLLATTRCIGISFVKPWLGLGNFILHIIHYGNGRGANVSKTQPEIEQSFLASITNSQHVIDIVCSWCAWMALAQC